MRLSPCPACNKPVEVTPAQVADIHEYLVPEYPARAAVIECPCGFGQIVVASRPSKVQKEPLCSL